MDTPIITTEMLEHCLPHTLAIAELMVAHDNDLNKVAEISKRRPYDVKISMNRVIARAAKRGIHPPSDMTVPTPPEFGIKRISSQYKIDADTGEKSLGLQWVIMEPDAKERQAAMEQAVSELMSSLGGVYVPQPLPDVPLNDYLTTYISNDLHIGALAIQAETGDRDYDMAIAKKQIMAAIEFLVRQAPASPVCIIAELGDITEMDDFKNVTPGHGHTLDVSTTYGFALKLAIEMMIYMIEVALTKHERVEFIPIAGNHDKTTSIAIRYAVYYAFEKEPRVNVNISSNPIKYYQHGKTLLGFAHGDGLKMHASGEVMAIDCLDCISETTHRFFHFGHNHKDSVVDTRLARAESHRNLPPLNNWASHMGFRGPIGTMQSITYSSKGGEVTRQTFNVSILDEEE